MIVLESVSLTSFLVEREKKEMMILKSHKMRQFVGRINNLNVTDTLSSIFFINFLVGRICTVHFFNFF